MQYHDQREKTLKRIIKTLIIILVTILCIAGIYFLITLNTYEQNALLLSEQQEQQRMLDLRPLYEEKSKLESRLTDITNQRKHAMERSTVFILLLTDCSETLVHEFSTVLQPYDCPAVICVNDTVYPGAEGCISVEEAKELVKRRWEFMIDSSSDVDRLTEFLLSSGLTRPVAIYSPNKEIDNESIIPDLPLVYYGNQSDKSLFNVVYGMQEENFVNAANAAIDNRTAVIMTVGTILPREMYYEELLQDIVSLTEYTGTDIDLQILSYSENAALQAEYIQRQHKAIDETEAEYQSITNTLNNIKEQIMKIETDMFE